MRHVLARKGHQPVCHVLKVLRTIPNDREHWPVSFKAGVLVVQDAQINRFAA